MKKILIIGALIMLVFMFGFATHVSSAEVALKVSDMSVSQGSKTMIPVLVSGALKLGAVDVRIVYCL